MTVYVGEFSEFYQSGGGGLAGIARLPFLNEQKLAPPGNFSPFGPATRGIRVHTDAIVSILVSTPGTSATVANARLAANQTEYFAVNPGDILSIIVNT